MTGNILVTGVSSGIGYAVAKRLLDEGKAVIGISRNKPLLFLINHKNFSFHSIDLNDLNTLESTLSHLAESHPVIDGIVQCAGFGRFGNLEEFSFKQIRELIDTNLTSQILLVKTFVPQMKTRRQGSLVFIGSESVLSGGRRGAAYTAAKSGIHGLVQSLRKECASSGIRIGLVVPGMVRSNFYDKATFTHGDQTENYVEPEEVSEAVSLIINSRPGTVVDEIRLTPQKSVIQRK